MLLHTLLFLVILTCSLRMCWNSQSNAKLMGLFGTPPAHEKVNIKGYCISTFFAHKFEGVIFFSFLAPVHTFSMEIRRERENLVNFKAHLR